jgi:glycosyltransferase involved in cell wall biosynthesis
VCRAVTGLARAQAAAGHRVTVLTTDALTRSTRLPAGESTLDNVRVIRLRSLSMTARSVNLSTPIGFRRAAARLLGSERASVVHCHELRTLETLQLSLMGASRLAPLVLSPHGTLPYATGRTWLKRAWDRLAGRRVLRQFDLVIALTAHEAADVRALWDAHGQAADSERVAVIPNGVDLDPLDERPARGPARRLLGLDDGPTVLYLGRLSSRKGIGLLLDAFDDLIRRLPSARLIVAGPDDGEERAIARSIAARNLSSVVRMTGMLAGEQRLAALAAADVFALPAVGEGLPVAALEAMVSGLPVLLGDDCVPGLIDAGGGLRVARDAQAWSRALGELLVDADRRQAMGRAARRVAETRYAWGPIVTECDRAYRRAAERWRQRR